MKNKLYTNKRQLKTLIRKYKKLCDKKENINKPKDKNIDDFIAQMLLINSKQSNIIALCNEVLNRKGKVNVELKQFALRVKNNI